MNCNFAVKLTVNYRPVILTVKLNSCAPLLPVNLTVNVRRFNNSVCVTDSKNELKYFNYI